MNTKDLIAEVVSLPVEERALLADSLLQSLNQPDQQIDGRWAEVASNRLAEIRAGRMELVPGQEVFDKIWSRFEK